MHPARPSRSRALPRTEGPGEGLQRALHKRTRSLQQPDPQTGTSTSFEGKVTEQKCDHHLVHAPLPCPVPAALLFLPACLPSQPPPFSFSLLIYFGPSLRGIWVTSASRSLRAKGTETVQVCAGRGVQRWVNILSLQGISQGLFSTSDSHDAACEERAAGRIPQGSSCCSAVSRPNPAHPSHGWELRAMSSATAQLTELQQPGCAALRSSALP